MNTQEFIEKFADALEISASDVTLNTSFRDLDEWNSLAVLSIIAMLDEEYNIQIENKDFKELSTVADIIDYIEMNKH